MLGDIHGDSVLYQIMVWCGVVKKTKKEVKKKKKKKKRKKKKK